MLLACALRVRRRPSVARPGAVSDRGTRPVLGELVWWIAIALALRCVFESVMVAYYVWPVLAVALVAASAGRTRLVVTATAASVLTFVAQVPWRGPWLWWGTVMLGLALTLGAAWPGPGRGDRSSR